MSRMRSGGLSCAEASDVKEGGVSIVEIDEVNAESPTSFEDAIVQGIAKASKTVHGIKSAWVQE